MSAVDFLNGLNALVDRCMANAKAQTCSCGERKHPDDEYCVDCQEAHAESDERYRPDERGYGL